MQIRHHSGGFPKLNMWPLTSPANRKYHILPWKLLPWICQGHCGHFHLCFWSLSRDVPSRPGDSATPQEVGGSQGTASVDFFLGRCSSLRVQSEDPQPSWVSSTRSGLQANLVWMPILVTPHAPPHSHFSRTHACYLIPGLGSVLVCTDLQPPFEFLSLCRG